jgi:spermidine/putrescine-binding protein
MGLAEPIDGKIIDRSKFLPQAQMSHVFSASAYSTVIAYRPDAFPNGTPKSWADFWDVKKFPGPRSLRNHPVDNLEAALMADGVAPEKIYPIDIDRAFRKLDEIHKNIAVTASAIRPSAKNDCVQVRPRVTTAEGSCRVDRASCVPWRNSPAAAPAA